MVRQLSQSYPITYYAKEPHLCRRAAGLRCGKTTIRRSWQPGSVKSRAWFKVTTLAGDKSWAAGVELATPASRQCGGLGTGGVALRASTPATLSCNLLSNHAKSRADPAHRRSFLSQMRRVGSITGRFRGRSSVIGESVQLSPVWIDDDRVRDTLVIHFRERVPQGPKG
jgi:hypothetical protein